MKTPLHRLRQRLSILMAGCALPLALLAQADLSKAHNAFTPTNDGDRLVSAAEIIQVKIQSSPAGRTVSVDNVDYVTPHTFTWEAGSEHSIYVNVASQPLPGGRFIFQSWSANGRLSGKGGLVRLAGDATFTANFDTQYLVTIDAGAGGLTRPSGLPSFLDAGWSMRITAYTAAGYSFAGWTGSGAGSYTGPNNPATVTVNGPITVTANFVAGEGGAFVTNAVLGSLRNDFTGWVGMQIVVGPAPLTVSELGRMIAPGNSGTHALKLVSAGDNADVAGGAVTIATAGGTAGQFQYSRLSNPVTLVAGTTYWLLSEETGGGDYWYDGDTTVTTTKAAVDSGFTWSTGPGTWATYSILNRGAIPVNFKYTIAATEFVTSTTLGTLQDVLPSSRPTGTAGMQIKVGTVPLLVTQLGRMMAPGNSRRHEISIYALPPPGPLYSFDPVATTLVSMSGGTPGQFQYGQLVTPVVLEANTTYWVLSTETAGEDAWYDSNTTVTTTGVAADNGYILVLSPFLYVPSLASNRSFGPVNFKYTFTTTPYITGTEVGTLRNDFTGWVGTQVAVGANPISVVQLGRMVSDGNSDTHTLKLVRASDGLDVPGGAVTIATSGGKTGLFQYVSLRSPVVLAAGATYWLVSEEKWGGDRWFDSDTLVRTTGVAVNRGFVWSADGVTWSVYNISNRGVGPVNFKY